MSEQQDGATDAPHPQAKPESKTQGAAAGASPGFGPAPGYGAWPPAPWPGDPRHAYPPYSVPYPPPGYGYPPPPDWNAPPPWANGEAASGQGQGHTQGAGHGRGPGMADLVGEIANGGNGLSSLSKMLNVDDPDFWKGALLGAAAVLLLTNDSVRGALFKAGSAVKTAAGAEPKT